MKTCTHCGEAKPADAEHFPPNKRLRDGLRSWCRACHRKANRRWREANPARDAEYQRRWRAANPGHQQSWREQRLERLAGRPRPDKCESCGRVGLVQFDHDHECCPTHNTVSTCGACFRGWLCKSCNKKDVLAEGAAA